MNTFTESFWKGLNLAHVMESDKRAAQVARQQAEVHQMQMQEFARQFQQREAIQEMFAPTEQRVPYTETPETGAYHQTPQELVPSATYQQVPSQAMQAITQAYPQFGGLAQGLIGAGVDPVKVMGMMKRQPETWGQSYAGPGGSQLQKSSTGQIRSIIGRTPQAKEASIYPKGFNNMLGKHQSLRNKLSRLESGMTEFGISFQETPEIKRAKDIIRRDIGRQEKFMKKRYPDAWADYSGKNNSGATDAEIAKILRGNGYEVTPQNIATFRKNNP